MIDLTPLDVRNKKGDLGRVIRGYDPAEVDHFLELVAERMEQLVQENLALREGLGRLEVRVSDQDSREKAVNEALVTAQAVRDEIQNQARREGDLIRREAEAAARAVRDGVERVLGERRQDLHELVRARKRFLKSLRTLLEGQMDALEIEESSSPADDFDLEAIEARLDASAGPEPTRSLDSLLEEEPEPEPDIEQRVPPSGHAREVLPEDIADEFEVADAETIEAPRFLDPDG